MLDRLYFFSLLFGFSCESEAFEVGFLEFPLLKVFQLEKGGKILHINITIEVLVRNCLRLVWLLSSSCKLRVLRFLYPYTSTIY